MCHVDDDPLKDATKTKETVLYCLICSIGLLSRYDVGTFDVSYSQLMQACTAISTIRWQHMFWNDLVMWFSFQPSKTVINHLLLVVKLEYEIMY